MMQSKKVVVGMSGGVDSAVAALLLKRQGYAVSGLFMKNWEDDDSDEYCTSRTDLIDAVSAADTIGIDIEAVNFSAEYKERVFSHFLAEYRAGRTPNPDIVCNAEIKFRAFLDHALRMGADAIATGHYARINETGNGYALLKGRDSAKDQSYFLYRLTQEQLAHSLFPLGDLVKREVREIARRAGLANYAKKDSTGICFIGERPFRDFLQRYLPGEPGEIRTLEGKILGRHSGLMYHTIGQRQGLGIGGPGAAWFVVGKQISNNVLLVAQGHEHPALYRQRLSAASLTWISGSIPPDDRVLAAKTRNRQADARCVAKACAGDRLELTFEEPQWAVTPGQSAVVYEGETCLGGGVIDFADMR